MKKTLMLALAVLTLAILPQAVLASCPDQAVCQLYWQGNSEYGQRVGIISTPTCWKVGHQCKPWNCSGNSTTSDYWIGRCISQFNLKHNTSRVDEKICVTFPEVATSVDGRQLFTKDYCRTLN